MLQTSAYFLVALLWTQLAWHWAKTQQTSQKTPVKRHEAGSCVAETIHTRKSSLPSHTQSLCWTWLTTMPRRITQWLSVLDKGQCCHQLMLHGFVLHCEYSTHERFTGQNNQESRFWKRPAVSAALLSDTTHTDTLTLVYPKPLQAQDQLLTAEKVSLGESAA